MRSGSAGEILTILRTAGPCTKSELAIETGQARSTVGQRLHELTALGLVGETAAPASTRGRPSAAFAFLGQSRVVLTAVLGVDHATVAVADLHASVESSWSGPIAIGLEPSIVIAEVRDRFRDVLAEAGRTAAEVTGIGIGLPGPVAFETGRPISPPIMPGWDGYDIRAAFGEEYDCPTLVDNDANVLAIGEQATQWADVDDFVYVLIGTGIGAGIISGGTICRGSQGAAGDIGHVYTSLADDRQCRCGNRGCVEAFAGGQAIADRLAAAGLPAERPSDVVALARAGNLETSRALREAGRAIGTVLAASIAIINPQVIALGGELAQIGEPLIAGIRENIYRRALPLASRDLRIVTARGGGMEGVVGAAHMVLQSVLDPSQVDREVSLRAEDRSTGRLSAERYAG